MPLDTRPFWSRFADRRLTPFEENPRVLGCGAEIIVHRRDDGFSDLDGPIVRPTPHVPLASADSLEDLVDPLGGSHPRQVEQAMKGSAEQPTAPTRCGRAATTRRAPGPAPDGDHPPRHPAGPGEQQPLTTIVEVDLTDVLADQVLHQVRRPAAFRAAAAFRAVPGRVDAHGSVVRSPGVHLGILDDDGTATVVVRDAQDLTGDAIAARMAERQHDDESPTLAMVDSGSRGALLDTPAVGPDRAPVIGIGAIVRRPVVMQGDGGEVIVVRAMAHLWLAMTAGLGDADAARFMEAGGAGRQGWWRLTPAITTRSAMCSTTVHRTVDRRRRGGGRRWPARWGPRSRHGRGAGRGRRRVTAERLRALDAADDHQGSLARMAPQVAVLRIGFEAVCERIGLRLLMTLEMGQPLAESGPR